jgi:hypothetical protein
MVTSTPPPSRGMRGKPALAVSAAGVGRAGGSPVRQPLKPIGNAQTISSRRANSLSFIFIICFLDEGVDEYGVLSAPSSA